MGAGSIVLQPATGITELKDLPALIYYDNLNNKLVLQSRLETLQSGKISVFTLTGKEIFNYQVQMNDNRIYIPLSLSKGMYILHYTGSETSFSQKFLIK
ncbi:hypothetical protein SDC9_195427 [bioreactor metagenome]|uniref:Secretion system C-terminal sorting domain-containing protein n=1 Tax=bioreactor metagenome TaxID=1076179 RepID=A0A645IKH2_9ZZZZ